MNVGRENGGTRARARAHFTLSEQFLLYTDSIKRDLLFPLISPSPGPETILLKFPPRLAPFPYFEQQARVLESRTRRESLPPSPELNRIPI